MSDSVFVVESTNNGDRVYDVYSRLLEDRIIFIGEEIDDHLANNVIAQLLLLDSKDDKTIKMYINSPGGSVTAGLAILDTMQYVNSEVVTVCVGQAASMAAVLLACGSKGKRFALPNSRMMIHEPNQTFYSGTTMTVTDQEIDLKLMQDMRMQLIELLASATGQKVSKVKKDCQRDFWMKPVEAVKYGLIDATIAKKVK